MTVFGHITPEMLANIKITDPDMCPMCDNTGRVKRTEGLTITHDHARPDKFVGAWCICDEGFRLMNWTPMAGSPLAAAAESSTQGKKETMENQHRKITGYRELTAEDIELMNKIKALGAQVQQVSNEVNAHIAAQRTAAGQGVDVVGQDNPVEGADVDAEEIARLDAAKPEHWAGWGRDSAQAALMYLTRAVAQPTTF